MKTMFGIETEDTAFCRHVRAKSGVRQGFAVLFFALILGVGLAGCSFLKPAKPTARFFVLTPMSAAGAESAASNGLAVGLGQVKVPAYLFDTSLAVRKSTNVIEYLPSAFWAERLNTGFANVLAADLAIALPTDRIHLAAWQRDQVAAEIHVTLEQFDVDKSGSGVLVARWRVVSPGGEQVLKAGTSRLAQQGPRPDDNTSGAVATLSALIANFSHQLAQALQETTSSRPSAPFSN
jgi:uncharacterized protein